MLITKIDEISGRQFLHNYSDDHKMIRKVGTEELYEEAWDPVKYEGIRTYEETDIEIADPTPPEELEDAQPEELIEEV